MAEINFYHNEDIRMPYSLEAEQAVLGSILADPECRHTVFLYLTHDSFYLQQHKDIFLTILKFDSIGIAIDSLAILDELVKGGSFDNESGRKYLFDLVQMVPSTKNVEVYAKIVREKFYIRTLITFSSETIENAISETLTADELLDTAEQKIYGIRQGKTSDAPSLLKDVIIQDVYETLKNLTGDDKEFYKGYSTGFSDIDNILTGLNKSDLIIIGARPSVGKTSFALNIARNVAVQAKKKVLFFSLEMQREQLAMRVLGTEARVSSKKMMMGQITPDEWKRLGFAVEALNDAQLYFDDQSSLTVPEMKAKVRRLGNVDCVIIDYLGLIHTKVHIENRVNQVGEITRSLKMMAKELNIPVICCAQLSRDVVSHGKSRRPQLSDLRESGSIEQDADIVMLLYREDLYGDDKENDSSEIETDDINKIQVIVAKNRHGDIGTVDFAWDAEHTLFIQIDKRRNET